MVKLAQISLDYIRIVAPVDGRLGEVSAHVG
jgi:multidrug resistance efflux pump